MSHAFAKDSRACAACVSWGGEREMSADSTLVLVTRYSIEGECRTAASQEYRRITKAYHTCGRWAALPLLKAHGALPSRTPGPAAAMAGLLAGRVAAPSAPVPGAPPAASPSEAAAAEPPPAEDLACRSTVIEIERAPIPAQALFGHWHRLRRDRRYPAANEIDTAQVREAVPRVCLLSPEGSEFVYRACGRAVQRRLGMNPIGRSLADCHPSDAAERLRADLAACRDTGEPFCRLVRNDPVLPGARFVEVMLPLGGEDGRVAFVLAYRHLPGG